MTKQQINPQRLRKRMLRFLTSVGKPAKTPFLKNQHLKNAIAEHFGIQLLRYKKHSDQQISDLIPADLPRSQRNCLPKARVATPNPEKLTSGLPTQTSANPKRTGFYWSDEWRALRYRALKMHGGCCQCCGARPEPGKPLHVDHIKPRSKYPQLELEISNLQVLCADCNLGKSAWDETDWRGNVVPLRKA